MYFEDEKDVIDESTSLHIAEDGTVSWEDILGDSSESALEFINNSDNDENTSDSGNPDSVVSAVQDDIDPTEYENNSKSDTADYSSETYASDDNLSDDFDIDKQLANASLNGETNEGEDFEMPAKKPKKGNSVIILLALLVALLVMGGIYYYFTMYQNKDENLVPPSTKSQMDNMTQEKLQERNEEAQQQPQEEEVDNVSEDSAIPVVNDDSVDTLKPVEPQLPEKKQIITIIPTGRINPFLPIQKYTNADVNETVVRYDKVGIPAPPTKMGVKNPETVKMLTIAVSGIMYDSVKPSAIITLDGNDYFVQKGDKLDDYKVIDIGRNFVTIAHGTNLYKANIGEEFKISSKFYGSAQYIPQQYGGGRQYYSVSKEAGIKKAKSTKVNNSEENNGEMEQFPKDGINDNAENGGDYVSEDDVVIIQK